MFRVTRDRVSNLILIFVILLMPYSLISILIGIPFNAVIMTGIAYFLPLCILLALKDNTNLLSRRVLYVSITIYVVVGILQSLSLLVWTEQFMRYLIPRFYGGPIFLEGRGVTFLAQEPSGAAFITMLMLATGIYFFLINKITKRALILVVISALAMLLMNRSGTIFLLLFSFLCFFLMMLFWYSTRRMKVKIITSAFLSIPLIVALSKYVIESYTSSAKFLSLLARVIELIPSNSFFTFNTIAVLSGGRFVTVFMGYASLFYNNVGIGHGIASYTTYYDKLSSWLGITWSNFNISATFRSGEEHKPNAYGAQIAMDMGIIGLFIIVLIVFFCWIQRGKKSFWGQESPIRKALLFAIFLESIFIIFFRSTTTMPAAWVMLAYVYDYIKTSITRENAINTVKG